LSESRFPDLLKTLAVKKRITILGPIVGAWQAEGRPFDVADDVASRQTTATSNSEQDTASNWG
jgi:hypothetical protein